MKLWNRPARRMRERPRKKSVQLAFERVEDRILLAPVMVTTTVDPNPDPTKTSLRQAIQDGNPLIEFDLDPATDPGFNAATGTFTITLNTVMTTIDHKVTIDGTSQAGFAGTPLIEINGAAHTFDGLTLGAGSQNSQILALDITNFKGSAINVQSAGDVISGNFLGTDISNTIANPGNLVGVLINNVSGVSIGSPVTSPTNHAVSTNIIGLNTSAGISITGAAATGNTVVRNLIGTRANGTAIANSVGISIGGHDNTIGDTTGVTHNTIDFNGTGISITGTTASGNVIANNFIGTDAAGDIRGNGQGVSIGSATNSIQGNTISGSTAAGILITGASATKNVVAGNKVNANLYGVQVFNADDNTIGGTVAVARNTIGPNTTNGIAILSGVGNVVRQDTYTGANGTATPTEANDIGLGPNANNNQPAPVLISASLAGTQLSLTYTDDVAAGTLVTLDIYSVNTTTNVRTFLGTPAAPVAVGSRASRVTITAAGLVAADQIIATATVLTPDNGTSTFSNRVAFAAPTVVTNTLDEDNNGNPLPGSLRAAITNAVAGNTIDFQIPGIGPFVITVQAALPTIAVPVTIDGTSQSGFDPTNLTTFVEVSGGNGAFGGFTLGAGSGGATPGTGSKIEGLAIENFGGSAITILSSNNTIGGVAASLPLGEGNVIAFNGGAAVTVNAGTGNVIQGNLVFGTTPQTGISLINGGNDTLAAPKITGVTSSGGSTVITLDVTTQPVASGTYLLEFFASAPGDNTSGSGVQAHVPLGTKQVTIVQGTPLAPLTFGTGLSGGQTVTGTITAVSGIPATLHVGDTSTFAAPFALTLPFLVTTTAATGPGSLADAIIAVDADTTNPNPDVIAFQIPPSGPGYDPATNTWTITVSAGLPAITRPVILDGTTQLSSPGVPGIVINGGGFVGNGLILGTKTTAPTSSSSGSTIKGLDIVNFAGAGIDIETDGNTIQSNVLGANGTGQTAGPGNQTGILINGLNNTIGGPGGGNLIAFNTKAGNTGVGVAVSAAKTGNAILGNRIYANDQAISLAAGANHDQASPTLTAVTSSAGQTFISGQVAGFTGSLTLEFFANSATDPTHTNPAFTFVGSTSITPAQAPGGVFSITIPGVTLGVGLSISATATHTTDTSRFSGAIQVSNPFVVTTLADNGSDASPTTGSLRQVIETVNANPQGPNTITFAVSGTITIPAGKPLPTIVAPVTIDGLSNVIVIDGNGAVTEGLTLGSTTAGGGSSSRGSVIQGLTIRGFTADAIQVDTNNNTIGGAASSAANTITATAGNAVDIAAGATGNQVRQNMISASTIAHGISGVTTANGTPVVAKVASVGNALGGLTTIDGTVFGKVASTATQDYTVELFVNSSTTGLATQFLTSTTVHVATANSTVPFTVMLSVPPLMPGQSIIATVTDPAGSTSTFSVNSIAPVADPFLVFNTSDSTDGSWVGSLRLAILNANAQPAATGRDAITFNITTGTAPFIITVAPGLPLPTIMTPVSIQAAIVSGAAQIQINGNGQAFDGILLGPGSGSSTPGAGSSITGLDIVNFQGAAIHVQSNNNVITGNFLGTNPAGTAAGPGNLVGVLLDGAATNVVGGLTAAAANKIAFNTSAGVSISGSAAQSNLVEGNVILSNPTGVVVTAGASSNIIGGTVSGAGNTIGSSATSGVAILSGVGNVVQHNLYAGSNGSSIPDENSDIVLASGANNNPPAPQLLGAVFTAAAPVSASVQFTFPTAIPAGGFMASLDFYWIVGGNRVSFLNPTTPNPILIVPSAPGSKVSGVINVSVPIPASITGQPAFGVGSVIIVSASFIGTGTNPNGTSVFSNETTATSAQTVTNTLDNGDDVNPIQGSLRAAIKAANAVAGPTTIVFNLSTEVPNPNQTWIITLGNPRTHSNAPLIITKPVILDGISQNVFQHSPTLLPIIEIVSDPTTDGIILAPGSDNSTIEGLAFGGFTNSGIHIESSHNIIENDFIGTDTTGAAAGPGNKVGVLIDGAFAAQDNTIGGTTYTIDGQTISATNIIGFNTSAGVSITGASATGNVLLGNYIGTNAFNAKLSNGGAGIIIDGGANSNLIGSTLSGAVSLGTFPAWFTESVSAPGNTIAGTSVVGNVIGFNQGPGLSINGASSDSNVVIGNFIGVNAVTTSNSVSGTVTSPVNSANGGNGIFISDGSQGNSIGELLSLSFAPTVTASSAAVNLTGILGTSSPLTYFGNFAAGTPATVQGSFGNFIAANEGDGVHVAGSDTSGNFIGGNTIGATTTTPLGNTFNGIVLDNAPDNTIGGSVNTMGGTVTALGASANIIAGNADDGIRILNTVGGAVSASTLVEGNLVSINTLNGIHFIGDLTGDTTVLNVTENFIGTTYDGSSTYDDNGTPQGNGTDGILLEQFSRVSVGGSVGGPIGAAIISGNVISGNGLSGIAVARAASNSPNSVAPEANVKIVGNILGLDVTGSTPVDPTTPNGALPLGNVLDGILLDNVVWVVVGGSTVAGARNIISGNLGRGIEVRGDQLIGDTTHNYRVQQNTIQGNYIGTDSTGDDAVFINNPGTASQRAFDLGNLSDGIFLLNATLTQIGGSDPSQGNVVSNNRASGIHAASQANSVTGTSSPDGLIVIQGNYIGTNHDGTQVDDLQTNSNSDLGNGSDGIFLDRIEPATAGAPVVTIANNVISGNHSNGIDLLKSASAPLAANNGVLIAGNHIGTNVTGNNNPTLPHGDFGNAGNGIFVNQSSSVTIGGTATSTVNVISGNHASGIVFSGTSAIATSQSNLVEGNLIGLNQDGSSLIPNAVAGIILSNADHNVIGGSAPGARNIISGNQLDGILLVNNARNNTITGNSIGTDRTGTYAVSNSADGIFLLAGSATIAGTVTGANTSITGNVISGNLISGNNQDGVQIFGVRAANNIVSGNTIGLDANGASPIPNGGNGVFLNNAGGDASDASSRDDAKKPGNNTIGAGNVISGNSQSGVLILGNGSSGNGNTVEGNLIGTEKNGLYAIANGGDGVFIYGSSFNLIGGPAAPSGPGVNPVTGIAQPGNLISGNAQAGILIFSPAQSAIASHNLVEGNLIGTNVSGTSAMGSNGLPLGNNGDGVDIFSGQLNTIGTQDGINVISGNRANGVEIAKLSDVDATLNILSGNRIGTNWGGTAPIPNQQNGVLVNNASTNYIGVPMPNVVPGTNVPATPSNVISGNVQGGIQFIGNSPGNSVFGNYIGVDGGGTGLLVYPPGTTPQVYGVFINNVGTTPSSETIGNAAPGAGNIIGGSSISSTGFGIEILGSQLTPGQNVIQGNLIGVALPNALGIYNPVGNGIGVFIENSSGNVVGGTVPAARNVISANSQAGVEIFGQFASGNTVLGNYIGTDYTGTGRPGAAALDVLSLPSQFYGVYILGAANNVVGGLTSTAGTGIGPSNVISGNQIGVSITGQSVVGQSGNQAVPIGSNIVLGNLIGTSYTGLAANPNFEYGVFIDNSGANVIGGTNSMARNLISANGIDGVEIFGGTSQASSQRNAKKAQNQKNIVVGNSIGVDILGRSAFTPPNTNETIPSLDGPAVFLGSQLYGVVVIGSSGNFIGGKTAGAGNLIGGNINVGVYITRQDFQRVVYAVPNNNRVLANAIVDNRLYGDLRFDAVNNFIALRPNRFANSFRGNGLNLSDFITGLSNPSAFSPSGTNFGAIPSKGGRGRRRKVHATALDHQHALSTARPKVPALLTEGVKTKIVKHVPSHHHR